MSDRMTRADVERSLIALGSTLEYPPAPPIAPAVTARLLTERAAARRPAFPGLALWPRRRILLLAAAGLILLLAGTAVAARLAIGAIEIRVIPTPPASTPTGVESGASLGRRVTLEEAQAMVAFPVVLPATLGPPAEVHVAETVFSSRVVVLVWEADGSHPRIEGTPWSTILMELPGSKEPLASKEIMAETTLQAVQVGSHDAFWISGPHQLSLLTPEGEQRFTVTGNVLLWEQDGTTIRLETALPKAEAVALAESIG
jgi:hypothetical protein